MNPIEDFIKRNPQKIDELGNDREITKTAVAEFLKTNDDFVVEKEIDNKLLITVAPGAYLRRVK